MNIHLLSGFEPLPLDLHGWNGNSPIFKELIKEVSPKVIIEIGSWKGQSSVTMAKACVELGLSGTCIHCVDTWLGAVEFMTADSKDKGRDLMRKNGYPQVYYQFLSNIVLSGVAHMIEPFPNSSFIASKVLGNADLIYVDGDHEYESVLQDINAFWPKLNVGGIMFGDDYYNWPGVNKAVNEFCKPEIRHGNFWMIRKT